MTRRYKTLQKKSKELEAELLSVLSLPPGDDDDNTEEIRKRFLFLNNLLTAEIASQYPSKPPHLRHIAKKLARMESVFREWEDHRRSGPSDGGNAASVCSCGEDDNGNDLREVDSSSGYDVVEDSLINSPEGLVDANVEEDAALKKATGDRTGYVGPMMADLEQKQKGIGGFITGTILGMILMGSLMLRICSRCSCLTTVVDAAFPFPT